MKISYILFLFLKGKWLDFKQTWKKSPLKSGLKVVKMGYISKKWMLDFIKAPQIILRQLYPIWQHSPSPTTSEMRLAVHYFKKNGMFSRMYPNCTVNKDNLTYTSEEETRRIKDWVQNDCQSHVFSFILFHFYLQASNLVHRFMIMN